LAEVARHYEISRSVGSGSHLIAKAGFILDDSFLAG
jgi:hypothetical protein